MTDIHAYIPDAWNAILDSGAILCRLEMWNHHPKPSGKEQIEAIYVASRLGYGIASLGKCDPSADDG